MRIEFTRPELLYLLWHQRNAVFVSVDGHVLSAVVGEDTPDVLDVADGPDVADEQAEADTPLDHVAHD